jgi:hypothetical protein
MIKGNEEVPVPNWNVSRHECPVTRF